MLGIVEATFGGQKGYLKKIVDKDLKMSKKSGLADEIDKLREFKEKNQ